MGAFVTFKRLHQGVSAFILKAEQKQEGLIMSKTITIPTGIGNPVNVVINGKKYSYPAGSSQTVPDAVADLFDSNAVNGVVFGRGASSPLLADGPLASTDDIIRVFAECDGTLRIKKSDLEEVSGETAPFAVTFTVDDGTAEADKDAGEILEAIKAGKLVYGVYNGLFLQMKSYTVTGEDDSEELSAATFEGAAFGVTLTVTTFAFESDAWTLTEASYELTEATAGE